jgi:hypothetical protein
MKIVDKFFLKSLSFFYKADFFGSESEQEIIDPLFPRANFDE